MLFKKVALLSGLATYPEWSRREGHNAVELSLGSDALASQFVNTVRFGKAKASLPSLTEFLKSTVLREGHPPTFYSVLGGYVFSFGSTLKNKRCCLAIVRLNLALKGQLTLLFSLYYGCSVVR